MASGASPGSWRVSAAGALVTLTTDFGLADGYVAAVKAAILAGAPDARIVDNSHLVPPGDIATGAFLLEYAVVSFPEGTLHLAVVDPGVGTDRSVQVLDFDGSFVVGPDNGLLDRARRGRAARAARLKPRAGASATFESRDVMAPALAALAGGAPLDSLGEVTELPAIPEAAMLSQGTSSVRIAHVDGYGTLVLDVLPPANLTELGALRVAGHTASTGRTFSDVAPGELVAYPGSIGYLELAARDSRAADQLHARRGDEIEVVV